jgi:hypothetical protein
VEALAQLIAPLARTLEQQQQGQRCSFTQGREDAGAAHNACASASGGHLERALDPLQHVDT